MNYAMQNPKRAGDGALAEWYGRRLFYLISLFPSQACPCPLRVQAHHTSLTYCKRLAKYDISLSILPDRDKNWPGSVGQTEMRTGEAWLNVGLGKASLVKDKEIFDNQRSTFASLSQSLRGHFLEKNENFPIKVAFL